MRSNLPSSGSVFCGEELVDWDAPPPSLQEDGVGLTRLEETSTRLDPLDFVGIVPPLLATVSILSLATILCIPFLTSSDTAPLTIVLSTKIRPLHLILLLCREFVLCGGAGGCFVFITDRFRAKFCLVFSSSAAATDTEKPHSDPRSVPSERFLLNMPKELSRSWSPVFCSLCPSCPLCCSFGELSPCMIPGDEGEEFDKRVFEGSDLLQFDPEMDVVESWELSVWDPSASDLLDSNGLTDESMDVRLVLLIVQTLLPCFVLFPCVWPLRRSISMTSIEGGKTALGMIVDK